MQPDLPDKKSEPGRFLRLNGELKHHNDTAAIDGERSI